MINEFDKEMDSLLRQTALKGEAAFISNPESGIQNPKPTHVDADEISLFAENALPQKARTRVINHLADCARCRKILAGVITLTGETVSENLHAKEIIGGSVDSAMPWYKKLFAFPQMAYAMGALVLVFSGIMAFIVLKNAGESQNSSIAQIENIQQVPQGARGASSDGETNLKEVYSTSSSANANMAATSNNTATTANTSANTITKPNAPLSATNSNASALRDQKTAEADENMPKPAPVTAAPQESLAKTAKNEEFAIDRVQPPPKREAEPRNEGEISSQQAEVTPSTPVQNQIQMAPDSRNSVSSLPVNGRAMQKKDAAATTDATAGAKEKTVETRSVKGKKFNRSDGVWYDSAYKNSQRPINVSRGTDAYKKLDADLKSIAENLGGVVVVVWKGKTYKIQ